MVRGLRWRLPAGCALAALMVQGAFAADVRLTPRASVEETYTDNVLGSSVDRRHDWITSLSAGLGARAVGRRLNLSADYDAYQDIYAEQSDLTGFRQRFLGAANLEAVEDMLFLDARAALSQQTLGQAGPVTATERTVGGDQAQVLNYSVSPQLVTRFGSWTVNRLSYRYSGVTFLEADVGSAPQGTRPQDGETHQVEASIRSGDEFTTLLWGLSANDLRTKGEETTQARRGSVRGDVEYRANYWLGLLAGLGYDRISDLADGQGGTDTAAGDKLSGMFWDVGVHLTPSPRTNFTLTYGRRYDGSDWEGRLDYEALPGVLVRGSYGVEVQTQQSALSSSLDNLVIDENGVLVDRRTGLPVDPNRLGTTLVDGTFRMRSLNLGVNAVRGRNALTLSALYTERDFVAANTGNDRTTTLTARFSRELTPNTTGGIGGSYVRSSGDAAAASTSYLMNVSLGHVLSDHARADVSYNRLYRDGADDLRENAVTAALRIAF